MALSRFSKLQFLLLLSLLLVALFDSASACSRRRRRHRRRHRFHSYSSHHSHSHYETTTEGSTDGYYDKRSANYYENNEVGIDDYKTICGKTLCPKAVNYPRDEIIDAVDRLHQHLQHDASNGRSFKGVSYDSFYTSRRSVALAGKPRDHWYSSDFSSGCKLHVVANFPQQGYSGSDRRTYYVVNVPNLRQILIESTCTNADQTCPKDNKAGASHSASRTCRQNYAERQFVVLPTNKRRFEVEDFEVKTFVVPDSCTCA